MHYILRFLWLSIFISSAFAIDDFLSPEQAFQTSIKQDIENRVHLEINIAKGYYLYKEKLLFQTSLDKKNIKIALPPAHEQKFDETFQKKVEIYRDQITIAVLPLADNSITSVQVTYQGCADKGLCYPPMKLTVSNGIEFHTINDKVHGRLSNNLTDLWNARDNTNQLSDLFFRLPSSYLILGMVLLGILLSFTPCVLPMLPIMSAIIVGQGNQNKYKQSFLLSISYVLGMALTYVVMGILVAMLGASFSIYLQNAWIQGGVALLLIWMAGSLLGLYELRFPVRFTTSLQISHQSKEKKISGALVMGMLSALLMSPCITPPLAAILLMIAHTGSIFLGAILLFFLAIGMGLPLLLLGLGAGKFLPRSGPWLVKVKCLFGILLLFLAAWFAWPLLTKGYRYFLGTPQIESMSIKLPFIPISRLAELDHYLSNTDKPIMLDFYADWCVSCKEMELLTFMDQEVQTVLAKIRLLKIDMTENTPEHQALLKRFNLFGPPAILFFDIHGKEIPYSRIIGYQNSKKFKQHIEQTLNGMNRPLSKQ